MYYPSGTSVAALAVLASGCVYLYRLLIWYRVEQFKSYLRLEPHWFWGHLKWIGETLPSLPKGAHSDYSWQILRNKYAPDAPYLLFDMRPALGTPLAVVFSHSVAEECSKPSKQFKYSLPKSYTNKRLAPVLGDLSMLTHEGESWKALRKRFNPGFAPAHLITLLPTILDRTKRFLHRLDERCETGEVFELDDLCTTLTFDIIGAVALDVDFNSQRERQLQHPIVSQYAKLIDLFAARSGAAANLTAPWVRWKQKMVAKRADAEIKKVVAQKFEELKAARSRGGTSIGRSVVQLALQDVEELTPEILQYTADQVKTFLFAGHDTTSTLLQWVFYNLSIHPRVREKLFAELDEVFGRGTSPDDVARQLMERGEDAVRKLQYTSAIIKETLRLYPPAGSARIVPEDEAFMVHDPKTGAELPLFGIVYLCHYIIQRDESVYGPTASKWVPERWVGNTNTWMEADEPSAARQEGSAIPVSAWRPFERGPRNCIGQELANIEARVIIACAARRYEFEKVGLGELQLDENGQPVLGEDGTLRLKSEMYSTHRITSKTVDGMKVRVRLAKT
ncbi:uncharacterized protein PV09_06762 [Verruconis gallopava]|uniref:Uncharacterized protein n=1 Tax=Verruconis gallopava TaxID=253628 RepID=A0A0D1XI26_9PEZI|nr:uncharacterized protein PV09_06762 [Verruconis gallopava]KIW01921.1 hypothetical protein PV09_06762 [Verruconis gallopava]